MPLRLSLGRQGSLYICYFSTPSRSCRQHDWTLLSILSGVSRVGGALCGAFRLLRVALSLPDCLAQPVHHGLRDAPTEGCGLCGGALWQRCRFCDSMSFSWHLQYTMALDVALFAVIVLCCGLCCEALVEFCFGFGFILLSPSSFFSRRPHW